MLRYLPALLADGQGVANSPLRPSFGAILAVIVLGVLMIVLLMYFNLWFQCYMSNANVSLWSLIGMTLRRVNSRVIARGKIMAIQAGVGSEPETGVTTRRLEAHYLAGGSVPSVIQAIIAAHRADIDLDFDRAAAIDLAGRDVSTPCRPASVPR